MADLEAISLLKKKEVAQAFNIDPRKIPIVLIGPKTRRYRLTDVRAFVEGRRLLRT